MAQGRLRQVLDEHSFKNWFSQTRFESFENGCLVVGVPSQFFAEWLRDHYLDVISESVRAVVPGFQELAFIPTPEATAIPVEEVVPGGRPVGRGRGRGATQEFNGFNPRYTFDRFVVGAGNRFAHAAAKAVAESPARAYNPLFLYGDTGLGKTHLMQAVGQDLLVREPGANVVFISSEHFTNQLIESIAKRSTNRFREKYRKVDVLLIDDIHFIAGKEATQEELFHTFNVLFDNRKQIVLSSDRAPKEMRGVEERLVSRFEWGLVTDIQPPDLETRVAILQNKAAEENHPAPPDVVRFIATYVSTNIRELEGALITALAFSRLTGRELTIPMVEEVLRDLIGRETVKPITVETVQRAVAEHFDVRIADLRGRSRQRQVAYPRQIAMYLCKKLIQSLSLNEIGEAFGGKDHSTVLYACQKVAQDAQKDAAIRATLTQFERRMQS
jgi:chromosomal replication initiator protein